jgi:sigma-B regulation protein RsbU (phosphoserine phosphatase)
MNTGIPQEILRGDALQLALGVLVLASGIAACLLFIPRAKRHDFTLLYFGLAAGMYGARLLATSATLFRMLPQLAPVFTVTNRVITGLIPVPLGLFFGEIVAPKWKKLVWVAVAVEFIEGTIYIAAHFLDRGAKLTETINSIMILLTLPAMLLFFISVKKASREMWLLRLGFSVFLAFVLYTNLVGLGAIRGNAGIEYLGFVFLLCCLGYVAAAQSVQKEERLAAINKELEIARQIQARLLPDHEATIAGLRIATRYVPVSSVAGDFYDFLQADGTGLGVLIADVAGHGVPAALSASMVKIAIRAQAERAQRPAEVLAGLNSILYGNMQGQFVTAGYVYLDVKKNQLAYAGAGHPPLLVWRSREKKAVAIEENGLFLGAFPSCVYHAVASSFEPGDRCVLYTDGILEAPNPQGEEFGNERLRDFLAANAHLPAQEFCDALLVRIEQWCGRRESEDQHDDLTLVAVDYV